MTESDELGKLGDLHQRGVLSDDEFAQAKARVLNGSSRASGANPAFTGAINGLRRSRNDRWVAGVCGGIAQVFGVASWILRLLFVLLVMCAGTGLFVYVLLWFFVPDEPTQFGGPTDTSRA